MREDENGRGGTSTSECMEEGHETGRSSTAVPERGRQGRDGNAKSRVNAGLGLEIRNWKCRLG